MTTNNGLADNVKQWSEQITLSNRGSLACEYNSPGGGPQLVYEGLFHQMVNSQKEAMMRE